MQKPNLVTKLINNLLIKKNKIDITSLLKLLCENKNIQCTAPLPNYFNTDETILSELLSCIIDLIISNTQSSSLVSINTFSNVCIIGFLAEYNENLTTIFGEAFKKNIHECVFSSPTSLYIHKHLTTLKGTGSISTNKSISIQLLLHPKD